jgi:hypothetical protein
MCKKWIGLALLAVWLGQGSEGRAQYLPTPIGAARMPDPAPVDPHAPKPPDLIPGPLTTAVAPPGPKLDDEMSLPANHPGAFQADEYVGGGLNCVFGIGIVGLERSRLHGSTFSTVDSGLRFTSGMINVPVIGTVGGQTFPIPTDVFINMFGIPDDGRPPPPGSPVAGKFQDLKTQFAPGLKASAMLIGETTALELSGLIISQSRAQVTVVSPKINPQISLQNIPTQFIDNPDPPHGFDDTTEPTFVGGPLTTAASVFGPQYAQLDTAFQNAPAGFEGNHNLFRQVDVVTVDFETQFATAELNARFWTNVGSPCEGILGVRYFDLKETLRFTTVDDFFQDLSNPFAPRFVQPIPRFDDFGFPPRLAGDPTLVATYQTRVHNQIVGPQIGIEGHLLPCCWLAISYTAKAMVGINVLDREVSLRRGDGLVGFDNRETIERVAQGYEVGVSADISLLDQLRLRFGYNLFLMGDIATALGQLDYNLANTAGRRDTSSWVFFHGPMLELQFLF